MRSIPFKFMLTLLVFGALFPASTLLAEPAFRRALQDASPTPSDKPAGKIDSKILSLVDRINLPENKKRLRAGSIKFSSFSSSRVRINDKGEVQVYVHVTSTDQKVQDTLTSLGFIIQRVRRDNNLIQGLVSYRDLSSLEDLDFVRFVTPPSYGKTRIGDVTTEGDAVMRSDEARDGLGVSGAGINIGVISDGVAGIFTSVDSDDIPDGDDTTCDPAGAQTSGVACASFNDAGGIAPGAEGTAMLEIIHDMAPDASLFFSNQNTSADMAEAIDYLADRVDVMIDDLGFYDEPFFEDGPVAQAAQRAIDNGVIYVSACGNDAKVHVQEEFDDTDGDGFHNFTGTADRFDSYAITIADGSGIEIDLQWDDDFDAATNDIDLYLDLFTDPGLTDASFVEEKSSLTNNIGGQPSETISYTNDSGDTLYGAILVQSATSDGTDVVFEFFPLGAADAEYLDPDDSIFGHPAVASAVAVAAIAADDAGNDTIEDFSSYGPSTFLTETRDKPDIAGIDKVSVTGNGGFPSEFSGTSASSPHVAACIALMLEAADGTKTADEIRTALYGTAVDVGDAGFDFVFGNGRADCFEAVSEVDAGGDDDPDDGGGGSGCRLNPSGNNGAASLVFLFSMMILVLWRRNLLF